MAAPKRSSPPTRLNTDCRSSPTMVCRVFCPVRESCRRLSDMKQGQLVCPCLTSRAPFDDRQPFDKLTALSTAEGECPSSYCLLTLLMRTGSTGMFW